MIRNQSQKTLREGISKFLRRPAKKKLWHSLHHSEIMEDMGEERMRKRVKLSNEDESTKLPRTFTTSISPPPLRRAKKTDETNTTGEKEGCPKLIKSPFQLTWIQDLPESSNQDAVTLKDLLGDPLISECWDFNYLHDVEFLMDAFDPDVRHLVKVHVIHGFWKQEDSHRLRLQTQAAQYTNVTLRTAYMPEMFGTHHSKMLVLFRHDSTAQVIIHTANMIAFDWANMTQAVWQSPHLPELPAYQPSPSSESDEIGSGSKFKADLLNYLRAYDQKRVICKPLIEQLSKHDFSEVRGALVASVPGKQGIETDSKTLWGWVGLQKILSKVPVQSDEPEIVVQISSIATLDQTNKWLDKTFYRALRTSKNKKTLNPTFKIIFPTADEIRRSLNGYNSGSAIHIKIQKPAQAKQLQCLKEYLCHWAGDGPGQTSQSESSTDAGRRRAAPHIKTYIRFSNASHSSIDWMLVTSSNLSKQAWGEATNAAGDIRICSYEIGVLVWPELIGGKKANMVPAFKSDSPPATAGQGTEAVVGARMAYDLPLVPYGKGDEPWCATKSYHEVDWKGQQYLVQEA